MPVIGRDDLGDIYYFKRSTSGLMGALESIWRIQISTQSIVRPNRTLAL